MSVGPPAAPILLVEDNADDVLLIRRAFSKSRLMNPLSVVSDGDTAIAYLSRDGVYADTTKYPDPALVILDLKLPRKGGLEVLAWLRANAPTAVLPVVVLTSSKEDKDVQRAYELGANSYLLKPVQFGDLLKLIETLHLYWFVWAERPRPA
jgi:CheY-like chemotaxis protein